MRYDTALTHNAKAAYRETQIEPMKKYSRPSRETAEILAVQALAFIAEEPERLGLFIAASGIAPDQIRDAARALDFLAGVLEHMLGDENLLVAFANSAGIDPAEIARAHGVLGKVWERDLP
jgi:Protein of unknown function (DUF3572)